MAVTTPRTRLRGNSIVFTVGSTDYTLDATSVLLTHEESDDDEITFADAANGGAYKFKLAITAVQSLEAAALHTFVWNNANTTANFVFAPMGNVTPSVTQPHFTGSIKISGQKPDIGGEASRDGSNWTFDMEFDVVGDVTRKTT